MWRNGSMHSRRAQFIWRRQIHLPSDLNPKQKQPLDVGEETHWKFENSEHENVRSWSSMNRETARTSSTVQCFVFVPVLEGWVPSALQRNDEESVTSQTLRSRKKDVKAIAALRRPISLIKLLKLSRQWFASCSVWVLKLLLSCGKNTNWGYRRRQLCHRRSHRHHAKTGLRPLRHLAAPNI